MSPRLMIGIIAGLLVASAAPARADDDAEGHGSRCALSPSVISKIQNQLSAVVQDGNGGLFTPNRMWSAIVDRQGRLCSVISSDPDAWPGSRAIAIAKASTANDFSNNQLALSTANLYGPTQPDGSLYGLNNSNPFNPVFDDPKTPAIGKVLGGIITFGGGVALYDKNNQIIGGLGISGDTSCADHAVAYRMRRLAGFDKIPGGAGLNGTDNIIYETPVNPADFAQPHCTDHDITP
jgi:uncharacterized protein GlcG (DUF336 family)